MSDGSSLRRVFAVAAISGIIFAAAFVLLGGGERPESRGVVIVAATPTERAAPAAHHVQLASPLGPGLEDEVIRFNEDVALLTERFGPGPGDPAFAGRESRLQSQIGRLALGDIRFMDLAVKCRRSVCEMSGTIVKAGSAADRVSAFALVHLPDVVSIAAAEGLEPGPLAIAATSSGETEVIAYLVAP